MRPSTISHLRLTVSSSLSPAITRRPMRCHVRVVRAPRIAALVLASALSQATACERAAAPARGAPTEQTPPSTVRPPASSPRPIDAAPRSTGDVPRWMDTDPWPKRIVFESYPPGTLVVTALLAPSADSLAIAAFEARARARLGRFARRTLADEGAFGEVGVRIGLDPGDVAAESAAVAAWLARDSLVMRTVYRRW